MLLPREKCYIADPIMAFGEFLKDLAGQISGLETRVIHFKLKHRALIALRYRYFPSATVISLQRAKSG